MKYQHDNLNEYEKNALGYIYAFSALGFLPTAIEINNNKVVMAGSDEEDDVKYKFNELDLDAYDYDKNKNQILLESQNFYNKLLMRGTDEKDLKFFKSILSDLQNSNDIWEMGNILVNYMSEYAPYWLRDKFYKHKQKVSQSLNLLLKDASLTRYKSKNEEELDSLIRNLNKVYDEEQMNIVQNQTKNYRVNNAPKMRTDLILRNVMKTFLIGVSILDL